MALLGILCENAATNLCLQSQTFDNATWVKTGITPTANNVAAPDGTMTADTLAATAPVGTVTQSITTTAVAHTFSLYVKRISGTGSVAFILDGTVTDIDGLINSSTWTRIPATKTVTAGAHDFTLRISTVGDSLAVWGSQLETGSDPTSYIPTTTGAVTRNLDSLTYPAATNVDGSLGTSYAEAYSPSAWVGVQQDVVMLQSPLTYFQYYPAAKTLTMYTVGTALSTVNTRNIGAVNKGASAWGGTTRSICLNGGAVATGSFSALSFTGPFYISALTAIESMRGMIRSVKFYNVRLTDVELQTLTGP